MTKPLKKNAAYADLCAVPDNFVAEILGGELYASPRTASPHGHVAGSLFIKLGGPFQDDEHGPDVWLVDPLLQTLEVLRLQSQRWSTVATHEADAKVRAEPFDAVEIKLRALWL